MWIYFRNIKIYGCMTKLLLIFLKEFFFKFSHKSRILYNYIIYNFSNIVQFFLHFIFNIKVNFVKGLILYKFLNAQNKFLDFWKCTKSFWISSKYFYNQNNWNSTVLYLPNKSRHIRFKSHSNILKLHWWGCTCHEHLPFKSHSNIHKS